MYLVHSLPQPGRYENSVGSLFVLESMLFCTTMNLPLVVPSPFGYVMWEVLSVTENMPASL